MPRWWSVCTTHSVGWTSRLNDPIVSTNSVAIVFCFRQDTNLLCLRHDLNVPVVNILSNKCIFPLLILFVILRFRTTWPTPIYILSQASVLSIAMLSTAGTIPLIPVGTSGCQGALIIVVSCVKQGWNIWLCKSGSLSLSPKRTALLAAS